MAETKTCSIEGCERDHRARGYCNLHYLRLKKKGDPLAGGVPPAAPIGRVTLEAAFLSNTSRVGECLEWTGRRDRFGYGRIYGDGTQALAHRYAYEREHGPLGAAEVDHSCHNPACVDTAHLRVATRQQNVWNKSGPTSRNSSGYRNIRVRNGGWEVEVVVGGARYGRFHHTLPEALAERDYLWAKHRGEFAGR